MGAKTFFMSLTNQNPNPTEHCYKITINNYKLLTTISNTLNISKTKLINNLIEQYSLHYLEQNSQPIIEKRHYPITTLKTHFQQLFRVRLGK